MAKAVNRKIVLENGREFYGHGFGAWCDSINEIVFNSSVVGYQEIVSDPSYTDQMIVMTYPLIGNYGITDEDSETRELTAGGLIVREYNDSPSNFRSTKTLSEALEEDNIPGISGVDTRALTRIIRDEGSMKVMITSANTPREAALRMMAAWNYPKDAVARVSCRKKWYARTANPRFNVVAVDCGIKMSIIRRLNQKGVNVTVVPHTVTPEEVMALHPDGLLLSNGPGNPENVETVVCLVRSLRGKLPVFGIGLGHQLIALAYGAKTMKLKSGHHGSHPVRRLSDGKIEIATQNHSYAVDADSVAGTGLTITHVDVMDGVVQGLECAEDKLFSVQYQPESAPGPQDSLYLFDQFIDYMKAAKER